MIKETRISKAIEIINYAIEQGISVKSASVKFGYADSYVKNVKMILLEHLENDLIDDEDENYIRFMNAYERYEKPNRVKTESITVNNPNLFTKPNTTYEIQNLEKQDTGNNNGEQTKLNSNTDGSLDIQWNSGSNYPADHIKTLDELLTACQVDLNSYKVDNYTVNKWDVTAWKGDNAQTVQNFQVKARLLKIQEAIDNKVYQKIFEDILKNYKFPVLDQQFINHKDFSKINENNMLEISIFDLHLGKLCWSGETFEDYDIKIATNRFNNALSTLLMRSNAFNYKHILFPIGNDFFNSDNIISTTTSGTYVSDDVRWQKTYKLGCKLIVDAINLLKQTGVSIEVILIQGNHDFQRSFYLANFLQGWFHDDLQVTINDNPSTRKYKAWGRCLIGFTHGGEEKLDSLPMIMANEQSHKWHDCKFKEIHIGHYHHRKDFKYTTVNKQKELTEDQGVTVRYLSSLSGTDDWHYKKGFIGNIKAAQAFVWNDETGLIANINSNLVIE